MIIVELSSINRIRLIANLTTLVNTRIAFNCLTELSTILIMLSDRAQLGSRSIADLTTINLL